MRETRLKLPEVATLAATRAMLGAGVALLLCDRLDPQRRRRAGWTLFFIGALSTPPLAMRVCRNSRLTAASRPLLSWRRKWL